MDGPISDDPMSDDPEERVLVAVRTDEAGYVVQGTKSGYRCFKCDCGVSVAPAGQKFLAENAGVRVCCMDCAMKSKPDSVELAPGAMDELIADAIRRAKRHQLN